MAAPVMMEAVLVTDDPCNPVNVDIEHVRGRAVLLPALGICSYQKHYEIFSALEVGAIVHQVSFPSPGFFYNAWDGGTKFKNYAIPFVQIEHCADVVEALEQSSIPIIISLSPDPNPWASVFESWGFIILVRAVPALLFAIAGAIASFYLYKHMLLLRQMATGHCSGSRTWTLRMIMFIRRNLTYHQSALIIEATITPVLAIVCALTGKMGTPILPIPIQLFFLSEMEGAFFVVTLMASVIWNRIVVDMHPEAQTSPLTLMIIGDFGIGAFLLYMLIGFSEFSLAMLHTTYQHRSSPRFYVLRTMILVLTQLAIAIQFLISAARFQTQATSTTRTHSDELHRYLARMRLNVIGFAICLIPYIIGLLLIGATVLLQPSSRRYIWRWSSVSIFNGLGSIFLVRLFQPRQALTEMKVMTTGRDPFQYQTRTSTSPGSNNFLASEEWRTESCVDGAIEECRKLSFAKK